MPLLNRILEFTGVFGLHGAVGDGFGSLYAGPEVWTGCLYPLQRAFLVLPGYKTVGVPDHLPGLATVEDGHSGDRSGWSCLAGARRGRSGDLRQAEDRGEIQQHPLPNAVSGLEGVAGVLPGGDRPALGMAEMLGPPGAALAARVFGAAGLQIVVESHGDVQSRLEQSVGAIGWLG